VRFIPALSKAILEDLAGAIQKSIGSTSASAELKILARGVAPVSFNFYSLIKIIEQAPSLILEELAAVMVPVLLKAGLNLTIFSFINLLGSSSSVNSPSFSEMVTGVYSQLNFPVLMESKVLS